jgi:hypothetical protein
VSASPVAATSDSDGDGLSDAFEMASGLNPNDPDSNHDGVLDPAEDPDGDLLSNLAEQRFGASPLHRDSDHDGVSDWHEDNDRDGFPDGPEQDRRPVPGHLKPSLANARDDTPVSYSDGCHSNVHDSSVHPCLYGDEHGSSEVAILGDSHAAQWLPALIAIGNTGRLRIRSVTKSGCPVVITHFAPDSYAAGPSCATWRTRAIAWLNHHPPGLIVVSDYRGYPLVDSHGRRLHGRERQRAWGNGLTRLLDRLPSASRKLVLDDTPRQRLDPVKCLDEHRFDMAACETTRLEADGARHAATERAAAARAGATFRSMTGRICPYDPCPVVVGRSLIWREDSHLTATYARKLWPSLRVLLQAALA